MVIDGASVPGESEREMTEIKTPAEKFVEAANKVVSETNPYTYGKAVFSVDPRGRKYTRIVEETEYAKDGSRSGRHVHCFIDNETGAVLKAAGWNAPAKGVRYESVDAAIEKINEVGHIFTCGGYLYAR